MPHEFFQTAMGQRYYERTLPNLVAELAKLNTNLETIVGEMKLAREAKEREAVKAVGGEKADGS